MARAQDFLTAIGKQADPTALKWHADLLADLTALRTAITTLTAKLDADVVTGLDDDYAASCDPAALRTTS